jgi:hypothetical protein
MTRDVDKLSPTAGEFRGSSPHVTSDFKFFPKVGAVSSPHQPAANRIIGRPVRLTPLARWLLR